MTRRYLIQFSTTVLMTSIFIILASSFILNSAEAATVPVGKVEIPTLLRKAGAKSYFDLGTVGNPSKESNEPYNQQDQLIPPFVDSSPISQGNLINNELDEQNQNLGNDQDNEYETNHEYNDYDNYSEENGCSEGEMYYFKSKQCVQRKCPSGRRDFKTGHCEPVLYGFVSGNRPSYYYRGGSKLYNNARHSPRFRFGGRFRG